MTYYVYKARKGLTYPNNWELVSTHAELPDAEAAARKLCPRRSEIYTEPGRRLEHCFFGSMTSKSWTAMIEMKDIHNKESNND